MHTMRYLLISLLVGVPLFVAAQKWDAPYQVKTTVTATSTTAGTATLNVNQYVKVDCTNIDAGTTHADAYVGTSVSLPDAGPSVTCSSTTCERIRFSVGEKFYQMGTPTRTKLSVLCVAGGCSCLVLQGQ